MLTNKNAISLGADTTVNFDNSMSTAQIQALIDAQPKNLGGHTLTFQFADGTYSISTVLTIKDFYSGDVLVTGNQSEDENTKHTNQAVILNSNSRIFQFFTLAVVLTIKNLKFNITLSAWGEGLATSHNNLNGRSFIKGNYFVCDTQNGVAHAIDSTTIGVTKNYYSNWDTCLGAYYMSIVHNNDNATSGGAAVSSITSTQGSIVSKESTQPGGSTTALSGSIIR